MDKFIAHLREVLLITSGATLLYTAFFMYEDEEGMMQNRLEVWWCKLDEIGRAHV